jgi:DNA-directed RNA polymerase specialized sigma24 family protein
MRIARPYQVDLIVGVLHILPVWDRFGGRALYTIMTPEELHDALEALSKEKTLEKKAVQLGAVVDSKDIAHDVLLNLWRQDPGRFIDARHLTRYAAKSVRNRCIELTWQRGRRPELVAFETMTEEEMQQALERELSGPRNPYDIYEQEQYLKIMRENEDVLSALERAIVRATGEGESGPSIAGRLQLTLDVVRGGRERAMKKLREIFNDLLRNGNRGRDKHGE